MKKYAAILIACFCVGNCMAQDNTEVLSHIPQTGKTTNDFVPKGYVISETVGTDFNGDGLSDVVLVLRSAAEATAEPGSDIRNNNRIVVVLLKTNEGYKLAVKSGEIVLCRDCGGVFGEPFESIGVNKGVIIVKHYGGSSEKWAITRKFQYRDGDFYFIGKTDAAYFGNNFCDEQKETAYSITDINLVMGDKEVKELTKDCKVVSKKEKIEKKPLVRMADYKSEF